MRSQKVEDSAKETACARAEAGRQAPSALIRKGETVRTPTAAPGTLTGEDEGTDRHYVDRGGGQAASQ